MLLSKALRLRRCSATALRGLLAALLVISFLLRTAHAQEVDIKVRAKELVSKGLQSQLAGRYDEAIGFYKAAYELVPHPELLFNLGQAYRLRGERVVALDYYRKYLAIQPDGRAAKEAQEWIEQIERSMREEAAEAARKFEEAELAKQTKQAEEARRLEEVRRVEEARRIEEARRGRAIEAARSANEQSQPAAEQSPPAPTNAGPSGARAESSRSTGGWRRPTALALGAGSLAALTAATIYYVRAEQRYEDYKHTPPPEMLREEIRAEANDKRTYAAAFAMAGAALLGGGIALWISGAPAHETASTSLATRRWQPLFDGTIAGLSVSGGF